jgi:hypothetical protein
MQEGHLAVNCKDARRGFLPLLDGQFGLTERAPLEIHLDQCARCQRDLESLRRKSALLRTLWRARPALDAIMVPVEAMAPVQTVSASCREFLSHVPPKTLPAAATVILMVTLVTYGLQRRAELGTALDQRTPEASPVRPSLPRPLPRPFPTPEPLREIEPSSARPSPASAVRESEPTSAPSAVNRISRDRPRAKPTAKLRDPASTEPERSAAVSVPRATAGSSGPWIMGRTGDEQNVPERETVRQERD